MMGKGKKWSQADLDYLNDNWGKFSLKTLAKKMQRSEVALKLKACRLGLGAIKDGDGEPTFYQLGCSLGLKIGWSHHSQKLLKLGIPVYYKLIATKRVAKIKLDAFWEWAERNKDAIDWSRSEENILGLEPAWVKQRRKIDFYNKPNYNREWTETEDDILRYCIDRGYTYQEICEKLNRTSDAIRRRCYEMFLPSPKRVAVKRWTKSELEKLLQMKSEGYHVEAIALELGRSGQSVRGKLGWLTHPNHKRRERNA
jgi:DNA-binding CsgD family transcriptional regulator